MSLFNLTVELSPLPDPDTLYRSIGVTVLVTAASDADPNELAARLAPIHAVVPGETDVPATPDDVRWPPIEDAVRKYLPELFPYLWKEKEQSVRLLGSQKDQARLIDCTIDNPDALLLQVPAGAMLPASATATRRAILRTLLLSTGQMDPATAILALKTPAVDSEVVVGALNFSWPAFVSQISHWAAPVPQAALNCTWILRIKATLFDATFPNDAAIGAVPRFTLPDGLQVGAYDPATVSFTQTQAGQFASMEWDYALGAGAPVHGLSSVLLSEPLWRNTCKATSPGFFDPYCSLWLGRQSSEGFGGMGQRDWQSELPPLIEDAGDITRRMIDGLRSWMTDRPDIRAVTPDIFKSVCASLSDLAGPGLFVSSAQQPIAGIYRGEHAPLAIELIYSDRDSAEGPAPDFWSLSAPGAPPPNGLSPADHNRLAMIRALARHASTSLSTSDWIGLLRNTLPAVTYALPDFGQIAKIIQSEADEAALQRLETIYNAVLEPKNYTALLIAQWDAAAKGDPDAQQYMQERVHGAQDKLLARIGERDLARLARRDSALDLVSMAVRWPQNQAFASSQDRLHSMIGGALKSHAERRWGTSDPVVRPRLEPPDWVSTADSVTGVSEWLLPELDAVALLCARRLDSGAQVPDPQPTPLVMQFDTLNDGGDQGSEADISPWLRGYSALIRRALPDTQPQTETFHWPHLGNIELPIWTTDTAKPFLLRDGNNQPIQTLDTVRPSISHGMRQVLLRVENRPWLFRRATGEPKTENGDEGPALLTVIPDSSGSSGSTIPRIGFGLEFEAFLFAVTRAGGMPDVLAQQLEAANRIPYLWNPAANLETVLAGMKANYQRSHLYQRTVGINSPALALPPPPFPAQSALTPFRLDRSLPLAIRSLDPDPVDDLGSKAGAPLPAPECVLLSKQGLPAGAAADLSSWQTVELSLTPPPCSWEVYDRWKTFDRVRTPQAGWAAWLQRMEAAVRTQRLLLSDPDSALPRGELSVPIHDPAVEACLIEWAPWRAAPDAAHPRDGVQRMLVAFRPVTSSPPVPLPLTSSGAVYDKALIGEIARAGCVPLRIQISVDEAGQHTQVLSGAGGAAPDVQVYLRGGELGELRVRSAVRADYISDRGRIATMMRPEGRFNDPVGSEWRLFGASRLRVEIATAVQITSEALYNHCRAWADTDGNSQLWWDRDETVASQQGVMTSSPAFDNVAALQPSWQGWRWAGKPLAAFPHLQTQLDYLPVEMDAAHPTPVAHAVLWDAEGFAERAESSVTVEQARMMATRARRFAFWSKKLTLGGAPRYARFGIKALHRYAVVYEAALGKDAPGASFWEVSASLTAENSSKLNTRWRRALVPGHWEPKVPAPLIKLIVPLTRSFPISTTNASQGATADLLVVLNEQWGQTGGLAETLEANIEPISRDYDNDDIVSASEHGADPIDTPVPDPPLPQTNSVGVYGPIGHTFDIGAREPGFVAASFFVRTSEILSPFGFAKLQFRRVLLPEYMDGYFLPQPGIDPAASLENRYPRALLNPSGVPSLDATTVAQWGEGQITLDGMTAQRGFASFPVQIEFGAARWLFQLSLDAPPAGDASWSVERAAATPPEVVQGPWTSPPLPLDSYNSLFPLSLRVVAKRIRDRDPETNTPAYWEIALSVYTAVPAVKTGRAVNKNDVATMEWRRIGALRLDEPASFTAGAPFRLTFVSPPPFKVSHVAAQAAHRYSLYTDGEWAQALPDATKVSVNGKPWCDRESGELTLSCIADTVRANRKRQLRLDAISGVPPNLSGWVGVPAGKGTRGQGLFHLLLVTRLVQSAAGGPTPVFVGLFKLASAGTRLFAGLQSEYDQNLDDLQPGALTHLQGYICLLRRDVSKPDPLSSFPLWKLILDDASSNEYKEPDDTLAMLLAISPEPVMAPVDRSFSI